MNWSNHRGMPSRTPCFGGLPLWRALWAPPNQHRVQGCRTHLSRRPPPWRTSTPSSWVQETGGCSGPATGWKVQGGGVLEHIVVEDSSVLEHGVNVEAGRRHPETRRCWGRAAELDVGWRRPGTRRHGGRAAVFRQPLFRPCSFFHGGRRLAPSCVNAGEPALPAPLSPPPSVPCRRPPFRPR